MNWRRFDIRKYIRQSMWILGQRLKHRRMRQLFKVGGDAYEDKHFYVIGLSLGIEGFFSVVTRILTHIIYAEERGMVPVVNMRDFYSQYQTDKNVNVWEDYFEQPCGYGLNDIYGAKHVTFSYDTEVVEGVNMWAIHLPKYSNELLRWQRAWSKNIVPKIDLAVRNDIGEGVLDDCIGCICRGTDYLKSPAAQYMNTPQLESTLDEIRHLMSSLHLNHVYVATEDADIYMRLEKEFGAALIANKQVKYDEVSHGFLHDVNKERGIDPNSVARDYYQSLFLVSQCRCFVGPMTCGTYALLMMHNKFTRARLFYDGKYNDCDVHPIGG